MQTNLGVVEPLLTPIKRYHLSSLKTGIRALFVVLLESLRVHSKDNIIIKPTLNSNISVRSLGSNAQFKHQAISRGVRQDLKFANSQKIWRGEANFVKLHFRQV